MLFWNFPNVFLWKLITLYVLVRVLQRNRPNRIFIRELFKELAHHPVVAAKKSHNLPSASWRTRKANGIIQSEAKGLKYRRLLVLRPGVQMPSTKSSDVWGPDNSNVPAQEERTNSPFLCFFCFIQVFKGLDDDDACSHWQGQISLLSLLN